MQLTAKQQRIVEDNMGLVGKVIKDKVYGNDSIFTYDDLFQIGCIGLCKAAATDKGGCFSTYAYRLIWNEICDALIRTTRLSQNECSIEECGPQPVRKIRPIDQISHLELQMLIRKAKERASGVTAKGIECLELSVAGYKSREIGEMMNADASAVRMWMTKARRFLMVQPEIIDACEEVT